MCHCDECDEDPPRKWSRGDIATVAREEIEGECTEGNVIDGAILTAARKMATEVFEEKMRELSSALREHAERRDTPFTSREQLREVANVVERLSGCEREATSRP